ncbi:MAG: F0F1 ATP synthase subunit delta, partial [Actinobacteria bacterium]|nr:F0F1 ATP synthase subunit delta [Actinomycetota bacterium]
MSPAAWWARPWTGRPTRSWSTTTSRRWPGWPARATARRRDVAGKDALVRGYAEALFAIAEAEGSLAAVEDELFAFAKAVERQGRLREALSDPAL